MDGKIFHKSENDRPIKKPDFPLPMIFNPSKQSELETRPQRNSQTPLNQRAHFYRKRTSESGAPVYGFYISEAPEPELRDH
jgi:hypothetical protein